MPLQSKQEITFDKVVIWGYKLHSHTHSYIHDAFDKAFKYMGYETYWFDDSSNIKDFDFNNTLFLTMGSDANRKMPLNASSYYLLHNCDTKRFQALFDSGHALTFQVYTHRCKNQHDDLQKIDECIYFSPSGKVVYMPWGTDLLPDQINKVKERVIKNWDKKKDQTFYWIGTLDYSPLGNIELINTFSAACKKRNIKFKHLMKISPQENLDLILNSYCAPTIVGKWQVAEGYIPCRIFKNISYGQFGITNSDAVYELFERKIVYNPDPEKLFYDAEKKLETLTLNELLDLMDFVKDKHTYINRIELLLWALEKIA